MSRAKGRVREEKRAALRPIAGKPAPTVIAPAFRFCARRLLPQVLHKSEADAVPVGAWLAGDGLRSSPKHARSERTK
ncbi:hypothetical protein D3C81_1961710 [compost metagenome]